MEESQSSMVRFVNGMVYEIVHVFWVNEESGEEVKVVEVGAGEDTVMMSFPGHVFMAYSGDGVDDGNGDGVGERRKKEFTVGGAGDEGEDRIQEFHMEF